MLSFENLTKRFSQGVAILDSVSCRINRGEHVGLVGPNGAGKSTLLSIITGQLQPDSGEMHIRKEARLGFLRQETDFRCDLSTSVIDYCLANFHEIAKIEHRMHEIEVQLATGISDAAILEELSSLQQKFELAGGYTLQHELERCLSGLGFKVLDFHRPFRSFSGGWQMRAELARILVTNPDLLLLDEPTNYLDVEAVEWLQDYLRRFEGTLILISHDRFLLNALTDNTIVLMHGQMRKFKGNYDEYITKYEMEVKTLESAKKNQDKKREQLEAFVNKFKAKATKASQAQSRQKQLDKMEEFTIQDFRMTPSKIKLVDPPRCGHELVRLENAAKSYDGKHLIYQNLNISIENGEKLAFVGWNGVGKTTLLRMLNGSLDLTSGSRTVGSNVTIGYHSQEYVETMNSNLTVWQIVRNAAGEMNDAQVRAILGSFRFSNDDVFKTVEVLSGGEKVRLSFCRMLVNPPNLLILDEPTAHLDIGTRGSLEDALKKFTGAVCLVSHDIDFLRSIAQNIIEVTPNCLTRYYGDYDYYRQKKSEHDTTASAYEVTGKSSRNLSNNRSAQQPTEEKSQPSEVSRKDLKRLDAERRNAFGKLKRPLEQKVSELEGKIEALDCEQKQLWDELANESKASTIKAHNLRLSEIEKLKEEFTNAWEEAFMELEELLESFNNN